MPMNTLLPELVEQVMRLLPPLERLDSALVCTRWAEIASCSIFLDDVWLCMRGAATRAAMASATESRRQYRNLRLFKADLPEYNEDFWMKQGLKLRRLDLMQCNIPQEVFFKILQSCPQLESLGLSDYGRGNVYSVTLADVRSTCPDGARESLRSVRNLYLNALHLTHDTFDFLLESMPSLTSLTLRVVVQRNVRFAACIMRTKAKLTKLDLGIKASDADVIALAKTCSESLRDLRLQCDDLWRPAYAALAKCTKLKHIALRRAISLDDSHFEQLIQNAPGLETFQIEGSTSLSNEGLGKIHLLKGLQDLQVALCARITSEALSVLDFTRYLRALNLGNFEIDEELLQRISRLKNLRSLTLSSEKASEEILDVISENLRELEVLDLETCKTFRAEATKLHRLEHLKSLTLSDEVVFTDESLKRGFGSPDMETLELKGWRVNDRVLASIAANHGCLKNLQLLNQPEITDAGFAGLLRCEPHLEFLALYPRNSLTEACLGELEKWCPRLRRLVLYDVKISDAALKRFKSRRPSVDVKLVPRQNMSMNYDANRLVW